MTQPVHHPASACISKFGDIRLMPVVMLGVKERDAGRVNSNNLSVRIEDFLHRKRTDRSHTIDDAGRSWPPTPDLQGPVAKVPVCRGETEKLALLRVLDAEMLRHLLDDVRQQSAKRLCGFGRDDEQAEPFAQRSACRPPSV